jgi:hypothetical protein
MSRSPISTPLAAEAPAEPFRRHLAVFVGYLLLGMVFTWPMILNMGSGVIQIGSLPVDSGQGVWNLWWSRSALLNGNNPLTTAHLFYPLELSLFYQTLSLPNALLVLPVLLVWGPVAAFNTITLLSFGLGGYWTYRLARALAASPLAALLAGFVFVFTPYHMQRIWGGSLELIAMQWLPLYLLLLLHALARRSPASVLAAGLALLVTTLASQYHGLYAAVYTAAHGTLAALLAVRGTRLTTLAAGTSIGLVWIALLLPLALLSGGIGGIALEDWYIRQTFHAVALVDLIAPHGLHPLWGEAAQNWHARLHPFGTESGAGLGLGVTILWGLALWRRWAQAWPWALLALTCLLLAMGPQLRLSAAESPLPGPFMLLNLSEIFRNSSRPAIFVALMLLPVAVLVALGLDSLSRGAGGREQGTGNREQGTGNREQGTGNREQESREQGTGNREQGTGNREQESREQESRRTGEQANREQGTGKRHQINCRSSALSPQPSALSPQPSSFILHPSSFILLTLVIFESLVLPWQIMPLRVDPALQALNADPVAGAVLELPPQLNDSRGLLNQICHGRPLLGGYLARLPPYPLVSTPSVTRALWRAEQPTLDIMPLSAAAELASLGVGFVTFDRLQLPRNEQAQLRAWLDEPGISLLSASEQREIYQIEPTAARPALTLGAGWYELEQEQTRRWRWMQGQAELRLLARRRAAVTLHLRATAYGAARPLEFWQGETLLARLEVPGAPGEQRLSLRLLLPPGQTTLRLVSPAERSPEGRQISLSVSELRLAELPTAETWAAAVQLAIPPTITAISTAPCGGD